MGDQQREIKLADKNGQQQTMDNLKDTRLTVKNRQQ